MIDQETLQTFDELYWQTIKQTTRYVVAHCHDIEDVKDILQEIYLEVLKRHMKASPCDIAYIMGIAKHKINDYYRFAYKRKIFSLFSKKEEIDLIETISVDDDFEKSRQLRYDSELVWTYLKKKPAIVAKIIYLYYYMELSLKEIAEELALSESNVKNYLYRTLKELRPYMERMKQDDK